MLPVTALVRAGALTATKEPLRCLDLCASPGSKTLQAWEMLLTSRKGNESLDGKEKSPFLVANDILQSRLEALQHAVARSGMDETQHIVYTCQDASKFELRVASSSKKSGAVQRSTEVALPRLLQFDVILCDVPCSGDGTCRKDRLILPKWTPAIGRQLHATQVAILTRAVELLSSRDGACICYSTCSLNPLENEAVVAAVLHKFNDKHGGNNSDHKVQLELIGPSCQVWLCATEFPIGKWLTTRLMLTAAMMTTKAVVCSPGTIRLRKLKRKVAPQTSIGLGPCGHPRMPRRCNCFGASV